MEELTRLTLQTAAAQLRAGRLTSRDLVEHCLARIDQLEDRLRAWVLVDREGARAAAARLDTELAAGRDRGPLHGLPIGIKDLFDIKDWPTRAAASFRESHVAVVDCPVVERLRNAGAILLGKTVTTQFACFDPPPTRNPWNVAHTPGGSSSGSAAGVAAGMCLAAIGSQTGGSIIRPASFCGVAGFKPTFGAVSLEGAVPVSWHLDHPGPIARTAADAELIFRIIADEPDRLPFPTSPGRVVIVRGFFHDVADEAVRAATEAAVARLVASGLCRSIEPAELPASFAQVHAMHRRIMAVDAADYHRADFEREPQSYSPTVAALVREGLGISAVDYAAALRHQVRFQRDVDEWLAPDTIALMPATVTPAPGPETTGDPRFNSPWSYAGVPAATIPCGLSGGGLPCGLQIIGSRGHDLGVLAFASEAEQVLGFEPLEL